jgi:hypothetical protein
LLHRYDDARAKQYNNQNQYFIHKSRHDAQKGLHSKNTDLSTIEQLLIE